jgi:HD domain
VSPIPASTANAGVPSPQAARAVAACLLSGHGSRLPHVLTAGAVAEGLAALFGPDEHRLLVAAATLHDIGYSPAIARTGFHPLDGALFLAYQGYSPRLAALVAHHSHAHAMPIPAAASGLAGLFPREQSLLSDALAYCDMHSGPDGALIDARARLNDIGRRHPGPGTEGRLRLVRASIDRVQAELEPTDRGL